MRRASLLLILLILPLTLTSAEPQPLSFSPSSGTEVSVWTNETTHSFVFNVTATEELDVNLSSASPYVSLNASSMHLLENETAPVEASINVSKLKIDGVEQLYATLWASGTITANSTNFSQAYLIRISVEEPKPLGNLSFSPYPLSVTLAKGNESSFQITITNNHPVRVTINGYGGNPAIITGFSPVPTQIVPSGLWTFTVRLSAASLDVGNYSDVLYVYYNAEGYSADLEADLPIRIHVVPPPEPPKQPPNTYRVQLTFIDNKTGLAVKGVRVILTEVAKDYQYTAVTGESGTITFQAVQDGLYNLEAIHPNYLDFVTSLEVHDNVSRVYTLAKLEDDQSNQSNQTATKQTTTTTPSQEQKGMIGLPYNSKTITISPGDDQTFYILVSAEGGSVGPIQILPSSSVPNWISLSSNWTYLAPGGYAALTLHISPPLDVPQGRYSRQFQILGGRNPVSLTVTAVVTQNASKQQKPPVVGVVTNQSSSGYYSYGSPSGPTNVDGHAVTGPIPRVLMKLENGTAISQQIVATVQKGTLAYLVIQGEYQKVAFNLTGGLAVFDEQVGQGKRVVTIQVNGDGDLNIYLLARDEFGNTVKQQPKEYGFGVYRFRIMKNTAPPEQVLISVSEKVATVGKAVEITAYLISTSPNAMPITRPFQGVVTVTTPNGEVIPVPLGLEGKATFVPTKTGIYKLSVKGVPLAAESVTQFEAKATQIPLTMTEQLYTDQSVTWRWPAKFTGSPKCWVDPESTVTALNCDAESVSFTPARPNVVFKIYGRGELAEPYDIYPAGAEVVFVLRPSNPVADTLGSAVGRTWAGFTGWVWENLFWLALGGLIVFAVIRKRLTSPRRKLAPKTGVSGRFGR